MSLQKMIPLGLAVVFGVVNGIYVFKPYLEGKDEVGKLDLPKTNSASASSASKTPEAPQQPKTATQPAAVESLEKK
ncbi:hypothetical protein Sste5346_000297 [Sporothrix stenoceras]|uniref:Uncharacterized protein n=1 Tax=Sporothrix stenoceras TaxID=5173 RepID=A0ABR3ZSJ3_9PEZI